jgi:hypothetical protein
VTVPDDKTYPLAAKNKEWQKKKSLADKAKKATKTGLGELLVKAEAEWGKILWAQLDLTEFRGIATVGEAEAHLQRAQRADNQQKKAQLALKTAETKAKEVAGNPALSTTARAYATTVANALKAARGRLKTITITEFEQEVERQQQAEERRRREAAEYRANLYEVSVVTRNRPQNIELFTAARATRNVNDTIVIERPDWGNRRRGFIDFAAEAVTITAKHRDEAVFHNDMQIDSMSMDGSKVTLK